MDTWEDLGIDGKSGTKKKGKHDKPKPWDDDPSIDRWNIEKFDPSWNESGMLEVTSFSTLFPAYREKYLQEAWPTVKRALSAYGVSCELDLVHGSMTVSTTRKTRDPYIIVKSREVIKLLSRSVPVSQAIKVLDDGMESDIIKIRNLVQKKERFIRRRNHLVGPNSSTLKALEIVTRCYIVVQGSTVAAMGSFKSLKQVRKVVEDCMLNNLHPVYSIKILMMKNELTKDPALVNENWERFLPKFRKKNGTLKRPKGKEKKPYTPFPPPALPRKIDLQIESGEYFLSQEKKNANRWREKQEKQAARVAENKQRREDAFVPPQEEVVRKSHQDDTATKIALSVKRKSKELKKQKKVEAVDAAAYIAVSGEPSSVKRASKKPKK